MQQWLRCIRFQHIYFYFCFFFFNDTATTEIYTLSLHDALPIYLLRAAKEATPKDLAEQLATLAFGSDDVRSEEHTSELQSLRHLVCRLLLEKKKKNEKHTDRP